MNHDNEEEERHPERERVGTREQPSLRNRPLPDENRASMVDPSAISNTADWMTATYWG